MPIVLAQPSPTDLLTAALDALAAEDPRLLDPDSALERTRVLAAAAGRFHAPWLDSLADLDDRELFAEDGANSARGWLRQQACGDAGQLSLARRLQIRTVVHDALGAGVIGLKAATNVCQALVAVDDLENGPIGEPTPIAESQIVGVITGAVPQALAVWAGCRIAVHGDPVDPHDLPARPLPHLDEDVRNTLDGRRELLAHTLLTAAEAVDQPTSVRLEPVLTLLARALSPHALTNALTAILDALQPERLDDQDEAFEPWFDLTKRHGRGWDIAGLVDDEEGEALHQDLLRRMRILAGREADQPEGDQPDETALDAYLDRLARTYSSYGADAGSTGSSDSTDGPGEGDNAGTDDLGDHDDQGGASASGPAPSPEPPERPADQPDQPEEPADPRRPDQPALFDPDPPHPLWGRTGPGTPYLPPDGNHDKPVEGGAARTTTSHAQQRYLALQSILNDAFTANLGSGSPPPAKITIVAYAHDTHPAQLKTGRQLRHLSAAALRRKTCDGLIAAVLLDAENTPIGASGTHRHATDRERRALQAQWGLACAVNGCCDTQTIPHHVEMFSRTGTTRLADLVPCCAHHHRAIHEGKRTLRLRDGRYLNENGWVDASVLAA